MINISNMNVLLYSLRISEAVPVDMRRPITFPGLNRGHSPFATITITVATGWLFEHGHAEEAARYFQRAGNSFRTMIKKLPCGCMLKDQNKRGMPPTGDTRRSPAALKSSSLPGTEKGSAYPHHGCPLLHCHLEITGHAHGKVPEIQISAIPL